MNHCWLFFFCLLVSINEIKAREIFVSSESSPLIQLHSPGNVGTGLSGYPLNNTYRQYTVDNRAAVLQGHKKSFNKRSSNVVRSKSSNVLLDEQNLDRLTLERNRSQLSKSHRSKSQLTKSQLSNSLLSESRLSKSQLLKFEYLQLSKKRRRFLGNITSKLKKLAKGDWKLSKKEAEKLFNEYYECLLEKVRRIEKEEFPIKAILAVEGETVTLTCHVCYRPDEHRHTQVAKWQFLQHESTGLTDILSHKRKKIKHTNALVVKDIVVDDAGQYFCLDKYDYAAVYQLDVFLTDKRNFIAQGKDPLLAENYILKRNLRVFTMWAPWTECNLCDRLGQRKRIGQCTVKKLYEDAPIFPRDYPLMILYPEGVPCHSTALPRHIRRVPAIGKRPSETIVAHCMEKCPTVPPPLTITDETGKIVEVIGNEFVPLKKPKLPPFIIRKVFYEPENSHFVLKCPGKPKTSLIRWSKGAREVDPAFIKRQTAGRVWVDTLNRLHLKPLLLSDTAVYSCWVKSRRQATIKVLVVDDFNKELKLYISYCGLGATLVGSVLFIFCICCKKSDKNAQ